MADGRRRSTSPTPEQHSVLNATINAHLGGQRSRGRLILLLAQSPKSLMALRVGIGRRKVYKWAERFQEQGWKVYPTNRARSELFFSCHRPSIPSRSPANDLMSRSVPVPVVLCRFSLPTDARGARPSSRLDGPAHRTPQLALAPPPVSPVPANAIRPSCYGSPLADCIPGVVARRNVLVSMRRPLQPSRLTRLRFPALSQPGRASSSGRALNLFAASTPAGKLWTVLRAQTPVEFIAFLEILDQISQ